MQSKMNARLEAKIQQQILLEQIIAGIRDGIQPETELLKTVLSTDLEPSDCISSLMSYNTLGTALHSAAFRGYTSVFLCIMNHFEPYKDFCQDSLAMLMRIASDGGSTVMHEAAYHNRIDIVKSILSCLTLDNIYTLLLMQDTGGFTALHYAVCKGHEKVTEELLKHLEPDQQVQLLEVETNNGKTVLDKGMHVNEHTLSCINHFKRMATQNAEHRKCT